MTCDTCTTGTNIFTTPAGTAVVVSAIAAPIVLTVDGNSQPFGQLKGIITSIGIQGQGGFQFMHALREFIYVYVFTERIGEIVINGLAFPATCNFGPQGSQDDTSCVFGATGLERVLTWYECNRITTRASPIVIAIGEITYDAFLVSVKVDIANAETGIAQFAFRFNYVPVINDNDDFCFPMNDSCVTVPCTPPS